MEFSKLIAQRTSEHAFSSPCEKITDDDFLDIIDYTSTTPSGYNGQPWNFLLIREDNRLQEIQKLAYNQKHIREAGNLVIVLGDKEFGKNECKRICTEWEAERGFTKKQVEALKASLLKNRDEWKKREMMLRNVSLACMTFMFGAENEGWATCPMMGFRQLDLKRYLELPENILPVMMIALGKRDTEKSINRMPRKKAKEICSFETYKKNDL